ncbi:Acetyltransferase GNAT domain-containing protein [Cladophialophora immunda]|nr:Acetyltransferase GNAT domain-containing protein [Cladophialophora immunda]
MEAVVESSDFNIAVPHPTLRLALTPPRESDGAAVILGLNHPKVYMNLNGPPYPYTEQDRQEWYAKISSNWKQNWSELVTIRKREQSTPADYSQRSWLGRHWTSTIRHFEESDTDSYGKFIGEIGVERESFLYILDEEQRNRRKEENDKLQAGDPNITWEIGFWLIPEYHGRGIMAAALQQLMAEVIIPHMNVHKLVGTYFEHNLPSRRVFEKCGFTFETVVPNAVAVNPAKIGGIEGRKVGVGVLKWERELGD